MYKSIVIAAALFNKGATTRAAIEKARALLDEDGTLTLLHVIEAVPRYIADAVPREQMDKRDREVREQLDQMVKDAAPMKAKAVVRNGQPSVSILGAAKENNADLIMIASHKPGLGDFFIGSTAAKVVRHAECSVLVAR